MPPPSPLPPLPPYVKKFGVSMAGTEPPASPAARFPEMMVWFSAFHFASCSRCWPMVGLRQSMQVVAEVIEDVLVAGRACCRGLCRCGPPPTVHVGQPLPQVPQEQRQPRE